MGDFIAKPLDRRGEPGRDAFIHRDTERANEPVGNSFMPFSDFSVRTPRVAILMPLGVLARGGGSEMQDHYDSYGIRETEVAIEEFVNRLVELYPDLDPLRASELIYEQVQNIVTAADSGEQY